MEPAASLRKLFTAPKSSGERQVICFLPTHTHAMLAPQLVLTLVYLLHAFRDAPILVVIDEMDALLESGPHQQTLCTLFEWPKSELWYDLGWIACHDTPLMIDYIVATHTHTCNMTQHMYHSSAYRPSLWYSNKYAFHWPHAYTYTSYQWLARVWS